MKAKSAITNLVPDSTRCQHRTTSGRRCKLPVETPGKLLCFTHARELMKADMLNLKPALLTGHQGFQTAQGINNSLGNLYILLANNYVSPRRAAVLAYINSLQLRTLPAIDADNEAGITDPTIPDPTIPVPTKKVRAKSAVVEPAADAEPEAEPSEAEPDSNAKSDSPEPSSPETNVEPAASTSDASTTRNPAPASAYRSYWDTIPDPTKKPS